MKFRVSKHSLDPSTRDEILNVALEVFAEVGFKEATVRQICKAAKANVCLISYYFGGKDGLYTAVFEKVSQNRVEQIKNILGDVSGITSKEEYRLRLQLFLEGMYKELLSKPKFLKLVHREMGDGMPRAEAVIKNYIGVSRQVFVEFLELGQKHKFIKKDFDAHYLSMCVINMFLGFVNQQFSDSEFFFKGTNSKEISDKVLKTVLHLFFEGVLQ